MHTYRYIQTYIHIFTDTHTRRFSQCVFSALRIVTRLYEVPSSSWVPTYADARRKHAQMHPQICHSGTLKKGCDDVVVQFTLERVRQWERQTETEREREGERERHPKRAWDTWLLHVSVILYIHASNKCTHTHIYIYFVCMYIYIYIYTRLAAADHSLNSHGASRQLWWSWTASALNMCHKTSWDKTSQTHARPLTTPQRSDCVCMH